MCELWVNPTIVILSKKEKKAISEHIIMIPFT